MAKGRTDAVRASSFSMWAPAPLRTRGRIDIAVCRVPHDEAGYVRAAPPNERCT